MDYYDYPYCIRHLHEILDDNVEQVRSNDTIVIDYCTCPGKKARKVNFDDKKLPMGICMAARNVSQDIQEKHVTGKYNGCYDELIQQFTEEHGEDHNGPEKESSDDHA